jgi:hypothetical protein
MFETIDEYIKAFLKLPESELKTKWVEIFEEMAVHTRKRLPKELLLKRRPNEEERIYNYRIENYEAITYGSMNKSFDDLFRIVNAVNYTIDANDEVKDFIKTAKFKDQNEQLNFELYIQKVVMKRMIEDPNGFLVWLPSGEGLTDSSVQITPKPKLIFSSQFYYSDENVFSYLSDEKTPLRVPGGVEYCGKVYCIFTKEWFIKLYQEGTKSSPKWIREDIYEHGLGEFPVITLGGDKTAAGYYESFFAPYLAFGNEAIRQFSDWQAVMISSTHPIKEVFEAECDVDIISKISNNISENEQKFEKQVSQGKLKLRNKTASPYSVIERKVLSKSQENFEANLPYEIPSVRFIQPNVENVKYSGESWEKLLEWAENSLNIDLTVGVNQSGVAKQLDKEGQYSMLTKIGNNIFDNIYLNSLKFIDGYINVIPVNESDVAIIKPSTFWVKNEDDLVNEITVLKQGNAPNFFMAQASVELAKKRFSGKPLSEKIFIFISVYDPLYIYTSEEKTNMVASGAVANDQATSSIYAYTILQQMAYEIGVREFIESPLDKLKIMFDEKIKPFLQPKPNLFIDDIGG